MRHLHQKQVLRLLPVLLVLPVMRPLPHCLLLLCLLPRGMLRCRLHPPL
jgi:hypothetical protein